MEITALIVLCIITALLALSLRWQRPEFAMLLSLGCGLFVLLYLLGQMKDIFSGLEDILSGLSGQSELTAIILKALGVCIVAELGSQCCRDAGETAIAAKVELAAKAALVMMSMPVFVVVQPIVLASGSPRRQDFLRGLGLEFTAVVTETPEPLPAQGETPQNFALRADKAKAAEVAPLYPAAAVVAGVAVDEAVGHHEVHRVACERLQRAVVGRRRGGGLRRGGRSRRLRRGAGGEQREGEGGQGRAQGHRWVLRRCGRGACAPAARTGRRRPCSRRRSRGR